jgi:hypothetical protein
MLRISHCLDNRFRKSVMLSVSSTGRVLYPPELFSILSWYSFLLETGKFPGSSAAEKIRKLTEFSYLIGSRNQDLPVCNVVPQPIRYRFHFIKNRHLERGWEEDFIYHVYHLKNGNIHLRLNPSTGWFTRDTQLAIIYYVIYLLMITKFSPEE